ncbi:MULTISPECIES: hypothetical protein [Novosphingobium]|uniref:Secreted protein n=1 Tax=Novosphingobium pentaromativorans US6-1 TaxID=1088721 RepID=G6EBN4_9SPHN|nr:MULTISPECIES: hypothetical protein [Novosphingobium]AIT80320.1 hypothetical protein JI59_11305 [Novosphingobium pentaromativorans US6-1]EHJ61316.1 hypothetical protein NSU_1755 [Novosphingobium pentaromativorans US6-1]GFM30393.1 uncharacterized protein PY1_contig_09_125 [Novosphingobium sp. PY1]CCA91037.1 conserved hypothetical protein [Novosphingobium sp. PP1Y]
MARLLTAAAALAALSAGLTFAAAPATAQEDDGEKVNQVIVFGDDPCPESSGNEITVCARKAEAERYRIPEPLRGVDSPKSEAWTNRVEAYETVGAFGTMSCSPVGGGGALGCTQKLIDQAYAEKANASDVKFSELIAQERAKRLSTIDAEAAAQQKRVEAAEKAYLEQKQRQQAETDAAEDKSGTATIATPVDESEDK